MASPFESPPEQPSDPPDAAPEKPAEKKIENFDELGVEIGGSFLSNKEAGKVLDIQQTDEHDGGGYVQVELTRNDTGEPTSGKMTFAKFMEYTNNGTIEKIEPPPEEPEPTFESSDPSPEKPQQASPESSKPHEEPQFSQETAQPESDARFYSQSTGEDEAQRATGPQLVERLVREQLNESYETAKQQLSTPDFALRKQHLEGLINSNKQSNEHVAIEHVRQGRMTEAGLDGWLQQRLGPYFNQNLFSNDTKEDRRIQRYLSSFSNEVVHAQASNGNADNWVDSKIAGLKSRQELLGFGKGLLAPMVPKWQNEFFEKRHNLARQLVELGGERRDTGLAHIGQQLELMNLQGIERYAPSEKSLNSNYEGAGNFGKDVWKATKFVAPRVWQAMKFTTRHSLTVGKLIGKSGWEVTKKMAGFGWEATKKITSFVGKAAELTTRAAGSAVFSPVVLPFLMFRHGPFRGLNRFGKYLTLGLLQDSQAIREQEARVKQEQRQAVQDREDAELREAQHRADKLQQEEAHSQEKAAREAAAIAKEERRLAELQERTRQLELEAKAALARTEAERLRLKREKLARRKPKPQAANKS